MSGLVIAACVVGGIVLYLFIGIRYAATRYVTREVARCIDRYPCSASDARALITVAARKSPIRPGRIRT